jgi:hypothetical protein
MSPTYVPVSVPEHLLSTVYALLIDELVSDLPSPSRSTAASGGVNVPNNGIWFQEDLEELSARLKNPSGRAILTLVAKNSHNGSPTTYEQLRAAGEAAASGEFTYDNLRAQLSWIAKYSKSIRNGEHVWPMEYIDGGPDHDKGDRYTYQMPPEVAGWWLAGAQ